MKFSGVVKFEFGLICISALALLFLATNACAQNKFFSTSSRGGAEGAKQNAQMTVLQSEFQRMNACTAAGLIYAPTHISADSDGCTADVNARSLSESLLVGGHVNVSGTLSVLGTIRLAGEGEPCAPDRAGAIRYLSAAQIVEYCDGAAWVGLGSAGEATSMVAGWPDALLCTTAGPVQRIYYIQHILSDGRRTYRTDGGGSTYGVIFNSSQNFDSHEGISTTNCNTSIDTIKAAGRAFNFIGGSGGGGSAGNPQLVADASACTIAKEGSLRWNTGDKKVEFCNGSGWIELGADSGGTTLDLYNGFHSSEQCTTLGGEVLTISGSKICRLSSGNCPTGWSQYQNWSSTNSQLCGGSYPFACNPCSTGGHAWGNIARETCTYDMPIPPGGCAWDEPSTPNTCYAIRTQIGCY